MVLPILTSLTVVLLSTATPTVMLSDPAECVDPARVGEVVSGALPEGWRGAQAQLNVSVDISVDAAGRPASLSFTLSRQGAIAPLLTRQQPIIEADCASLPQLIAVIVGRHLAELPRDAWPEPPPPPVVDPSPGESAPSRPLQEAAPVTANLTLRLGAEVGLDSPLWGGCLGVDATLFGAEGYALLLGAEVLTFAPVTVGEGAARLTTVIGRLGPAWELPLGDLVFSVALGLGAGATIALGSGFERDITAVGASLRAFSQASLRARSGLSATIGFGVVALRSSLRTTEMSTGVEAPAARLSLSLGYVFGD